jgi:hypothetical protein
MKLIDADQAQNVTITATVNGGGGDWAPMAEAYPIKLGWGVELSAAGVFFLDTSGQNEIFDIAQYSTNDTVGYASIVGAAGNQVGVGMNQANNTQTTDVSAIQVEGSPAQTLFIANAVVNGPGPLSTGPLDSAIAVTAGATLTLGQDQSAGVTGTVNIGNTLNNYNTDGWIGIDCQSNAATMQGCIINDDPSLTGHSVVIQGQANTDIIAADYASITLNSAPVIGVPPSAVGFGMCDLGGKPDLVSSQYGYAISLIGPATMTFNGGTVQCLSGGAFQLVASANGSPTLSMDGGIIQNTDMGIYAGAGTVTASNMAIRFNYIGVQQDTGGSVDLSGGGNAVICSNQSENSQAYPYPGVDVYNTSDAGLNASNVAWDTTGPDYFSCDNAFTKCTCLITTCTDIAGGQDMDAVEDSTNKGGITTTGNTQSPLALDAGCM